MKWRTLIVDDEAPARQHLRRLLTSHPEIEIVGEASDIFEAAEHCATRTPELILLDIQMPRATGFELLPRLNPVPRIIFVTAHEDFAVRAFEVNAVDYLLKPIFADRLALALQRVLSQMGQEADSRLGADESLFLHDDKALRLVPARKIVCIQAEGNYSRVILNDGKSLLIYRNLNQWEQRLPKSLFARVDRSLIVNLIHILEVKVLDRNTGNLFLSTLHEPVVIGRTALGRIKALLNEQSEAPAVTACEA